MLAYLRCESLTVSRKVMALSQRLLALSVRRRARSGTSGSGRSGRSPVTPPASPATSARSSTVTVISGKSPFPPSG